MNGSKVAKPLLSDAEAETKAVVASANWKSATSWSAVNSPVSVSAPRRGSPRLAKLQLAVEGGTMPPTPADSLGHDGSGSPARMGAASAAGAKDSEVKRTAAA